MSHVSVRPATLADVPAIQRVARAAWHAAYDDVLGPDAVETLQDRWYDRDGLRASIEADPAVFLVAAADGEPAGFAHASPDETGDWHLARIYVDPDRWGEGVGTALLGQVEAALRTRGVEAYRLAVLADNDVGVGFYESRGFERVDTREVELAGVPVTEHWYRKTL
jgi:ribosomal protein S18 acetylase RimI-like enzyme